MPTIDTYGLSESSAHTEGHIATLVKISSAEMLVYNKLRVHFDREMKKNNNLTDRLYYTVIPVTAGATSCYIIKVEAPFVSYPEYVDVITSEMTNGSSYKVYVDSDGPVDIEDTPVDPNNNEQEFIAIGAIPTVDKIIAISENRVDIVFTENMRINKAIKNPTKYSFDKGLVVTDVVSVEGDTVRLATSDQTPGEEYTLTINP